MTVGWQKCPARGLVRAAAVIVILGPATGGCGGGTDPHVAFARGDYASAYGQWQIRAAGGDVEAQNYLGVHHQLGLGVKRDAAVAAGWYREAARRGYADAQRNLATLYRTGLGVPVDNQLAYGWYHYAALQGNPIAQNFIAVMTDDLTPNQMDQARRRVRTELQYEVGSADIRAPGGTLAAPSQQSSPQ
jgi:hypothetical protein